MDMSIVSKGEEKGQGTHPPTHSLIDHSGLLLTVALTRWVTIRAARQCGKVRHWRHRTRSSPAVLSSVYRTWGPEGLYRCAGPTRYSARACKPTRYSVQACGAALQCRCAGPTHATVYSGRAGPARYGVQACRTNTLQCTGVQDQHAAVYRRAGPAYSIRACGTTRHSVQACSESSYVCSNFRSVFRILQMSLFRVQHKHMLNIV
ncbi:hypothetical protein RRG08_063039 [Elysia crispata]|uniref:Uncharacterized protein n=1 Tax=Elysia crispata TaxID=231223 RepID=A0AAE1A9A4_9GAST|nr:hypothetical protein RRG08_063039 [Elysia crispata]